MTAAWMQIAKHQFHHDRQFQHPRHRRPEAGQTPSATGLPRYPAWRSARTPRGGAAHPRWSTRGARLCRIPSLSIACGCAIGVLLTSFPADESAAARQRQAVMMRSGREIRGGLARVLRKDIKGDWAFYRQFMQQEAERRGVTLIHPKVMCLSSSLGDRIRASRCSEGIPR